MLARPARVRLLLIAWLAAIAALAAYLVACGTTAAGTTGVTPITGILIRSDSLVAGHGCGLEPSKVFKYAAIVSSEPTDGGTSVTVASVYDCFADGTFSQLPTSGTNARFNVQIVAFNSVAYARANANGAIDNTDAGTLPTILLEQIPTATWTTHCTATQQQSIQVLAVCDPLTITPGTATVDLPTQSFAANRDGGAFTCGEYAVVDVVYRGSLVGESRVICPAPLALLAPLGTLSLDVALQTEAGAPVATTSCTAETSPGLHVVPTCLVAQPAAP